MLPGAAPLTGVRVLELADGRSDLCGRYLADLGADVVLAESPGGSPGRARSLYFQTHDANKRSVVLDLTTDDGRADFRELAARADILIETTRPGTLARLGLPVGELQALNPSLVVLSITDYGQTGPYRDFVATNDTHIALGGVLCRSGLPGEPPLLPPGELAFEASAVQAAWCALLAYQNAQTTGRGDHLDFSIYEATAQIIDPGLGTIGSGAIAAGGTMTTRGRPVASHLYPIFRCADGYVRICVLSPRQWRGMLTWLGDPAELSGDDLVATANRFERWDRVGPFIAALFRNEPAAELVAAGQQLGVPIAALRSPADVLRTEHFHERGAFVSIAGPDGRMGMMPSGFVEVDGARAGYRRPAPVLAESSRDELVRDWPPRTTAGAESGPDRIAPLAGLRVLDLGVIVAGAEGGRLFADQGADVIKIESREFPDGSRLSATGAIMSASFAVGHRGKRSLGIDLRSPRGHELFRQLVADSDIVLTNFRPGTMESLGLGYDVLREINPGIVFVESSALGRTGPWARSLGYGPLVRASSSLTTLWRYADIDDSFSDALTIFPDHLAARVMGVAVLALLSQRRRTGIGGTVAVAQAEVIMNVLTEEFLRESLEPGSFAASADTTVYPCSGEDEWCVIDPRDDADRVALAAVLDGETLADWAAARTPGEVMSVLQAAGVPAARMQRIAEYESDPQFGARGFIRHLVQPQLDGPLTTESGPCLSQHLREPDIRPAPIMGEHTREIAAELLKLDSASIEQLIGENILQVGPSE